MSTLFDAPLNPARALFCGSEIGGGEPEPIVESIVEPDYSGCDSLEARAEAFHEANPHVYRALRRLALEQRRAGRARGGIAQLFEVLRYRHSLRTDGDEFKLNNSYRSIYARWLMEREPALEGFFETRRRTAA